MSVEQLADARKQHQIELMDPVPDDNSWQDRQSGYDSHHFSIDWEHTSAVCPQGNRSCSWSLAKTCSERPVEKIKFRHADYFVCPVIALCTDNHEQRRILSILSPQADFETQQWARQRQQTHEFRTRCAIRAGVEGTISQAAVALGGQRSRYQGRAKTHFQHLVTAAAINLLCVLDWLHDIPRSTTPKSHFA
jgi:transposase